MRKIYLLKFLVLLVITLPITSKAQIINLLSLGDSQKHIINLNFGWDYSLAYGLGYSYRLNTKHPMFISSSITVPLGKDFLDDFKSKIGLQAQIYRIDNFILLSTFNGGLKKYETPLVRMVNVSCEINSTAGYFKSNWFFGLEGRIDIPTVVHFNHGQFYKDNYANVKDGWYKNELNGNLEYGFVAGLSFNSNDLFLSVGKITFLDFKNSPLIPYYLKLAFNVKR